mmetsp:Transcript_19658/g.33216  ORF Transcript_19658/g.33216 Transcript_19658/m.33216 type:complete len:200 (-) Transcript_19658:115-714(-)
MARAWASYNRLLDSNPILTKALTSFTGFTVGDALAQNFVEKKEKYDFARTARLASFGFLVHGPTGHFFYGALDGKFPGTTPITVATKVLIDQTVWNPIFGVMFFSYLGICEGKTFKQIQEKLRADLSTAVMGSWAVWVPAHTLNFAFVPPNQRLLYINTIQIGYNIFLSFLGNRKVPEKPVLPASEEVPEMPVLPKSEK